jgi:hypothetical protein
VNDDEVRALVREAIHKHLGATASGPTSLAPVPSSCVEKGPAGVSPLLLSFSRYEIQRVSDDGMCLIEPAVRCNRCGYCECHGH